MACYLCFSKPVLLFSALVLWAFSTLLEAQDPSQLSSDYYLKTCPIAEQIVRKQMEYAVQADPRNAAAILRLHFHDCFVQGCDGSVLLDDTVTLIGEKKAEQNVKSLKGFDIVDKIKTNLEAGCPGIVTCADLLAIAARDAVVLLGGPYWDVPVGRKDSKTASLDQANTDIPTPQQGLVTIISKFLAKGLSATDMVALAGAHTIGVSRCASFRDRIYGDFELTAKDEASSLPYLSKLKEDCPLDGGDDNVSPMDHFTPNLFDNAFFETLLKGTGLLNSDQEMYSSLVGFETSSLVEKYWADPVAFFNQFSDSMVKMGNITNPEGGEVRKNCRFVNT
ncbi:peroxidase 11 [Elaeis guineensis]|uniref:Peroxidase n=1 Tax=Elaeis guineensis var. tenera TaxID=51953 RepID=A0A6J0PLR2_ELAGV|nr:peroxidase 11 [Elaeis guineensis]